eukprot:scaffold19583_cov62-Phaeocystis_antarctica.AAC.1
MTLTASRATSSRAVFTGCHRCLHCHGHGARAAHRHCGASAAACLQQAGGDPKLPPNPKVRKCLNGSETQGKAKGIVSS